MPSKSSKEPHTHMYAYMCICIHRPALARTTNTDRPIRPSNRSRANEAGVASKSTYMYLRNDTSISARTHARGIRIHICIIIYICMYRYIYTHVYVYIYNKKNIAKVSEKTAIAHGATSISNSRRRQTFHNGHKKISRSLFNSVRFIQKDGARTKKCITDAENTMFYEFG